jgi:TATA-binding protein-associated factor Taf7
VGARALLFNRVNPDDIKGGHNNKFNFCLAKNMSTRSRVAAANAAVEEEVVNYSDEEDEEEEEDDQSDELDTSVRLVQPQSYNRSLFELYRWSPESSCTNYS